MDSSPFYHIIMPRDFHMYDTNACTFKRIGFVNQSMHSPKFEVFDAETADLLRKRVQKGRIQSDDRRCIGGDVPQHEAG
jgi:hypothetical protein